jgi:hypothetical protein
VILEKIEQIVGAAVMIDDLIITVERPARHHTVLHAIHKRFREAPVGFQFRQGFVTSTGRFVGRKEGLAIATAAEQIVKKHPQPDELYSEDMW